ncbi:assimilatory nitrate reductase large subunit [Xanthomonas phage vB_XciM_LucasX]|nr:assimilatory nitrate reductase large subunit [Xanthomonas phage vB_XciM_LucasX]
MSAKVRFTTKIFDLEEDGQSFIAISSRGKTRLGRALAAGAGWQLLVPGYGGFTSLAGLIRFMAGDQRGVNKVICGADYDDALTESVKSVYEELVVGYVRAIFSCPRGQELGLLRLLHENPLPFAIVYNIDDDWVASKPAPWFEEALNELYRGGNGQASSPAGLSNPHFLQWDPSEIDNKDPAFIRALEGFDELEKQHGTVGALEQVLAKPVFKDLSKEERNAMIRTYVLSVTADPATTHQFIPPPSEK